MTEYLDHSGLSKYLDQLRFNTVGYGCTTCIGNSGPLSAEITKDVRDHDLVVAAVLSGNRNFEGRINSEVKANYLASPPLVVAYALAGSMDIDLATEPLGTGRDGKPVFLRELWPSQGEIQRTILESVHADMFRETYAHVFDGDERLCELPVPTGDLYEWDAKSTYVKNPPYFDGMTQSPPPLKEIKNWCACSLSWATRSPPTTSRRQDRSSPTVRPASISSLTEFPRATSTPTVHAGATTRSDLVVATARAVGIEVILGNAMGDEVFARRTIGLDRSGRRDVVGGDRVA